MSAGSSRRLMRSPTSFGSTVAMALSSGVALCLLASTGADWRLERHIVFEGQTTLLCMSAIIEATIHQLSLLTHRIPQGGLRGRRHVLPPWRGWSPSDVESWDRRCQNN